MNSEGSWKFNFPGHEAEPNAPLWKWSPGNIIGNKTRQGPRLFGKKSISEMAMGPGFGAGIGCGVGAGIGLVGGMGFSSSPWNHLQMVLGLGIGCGVGVGFGYGQGIGYHLDMEGAKSALERMETDQDREVVIQI